MTKCVHCTVVWGHYSISIITTGKLSIKPVTDYTYTSRSAILQQTGAGGETILTCRNGITTTQK